MVVDELVKSGDEVMKKSEGKSRVNARQII